MVSENEDRPDIRKPTSLNSESDFHVLVVDDDDDLRALIRRALQSRGMRVKEAHSFETFQKQLKSYSFDAALVDVFLDGDNGLELMSYLIHECPFTRAFIMTAKESVSLAVDAMERGAASFLPKSMGVNQMADCVRDRLEKSTAPHLPSGSEMSDLGFVGRSESVRQVIEQIRQMRDADSTVLILGESGTGKELVARGLHSLSSRARGRFEAINCGAIPETLLESELFGHMRGAFTDARSDKKGLFEICSNGTLVLDEIGDMPLSLQVKLLRVLQEREVRPLGSSTTVKVNTRVIASTHRDLMAEVQARRFRQDLYFRLSVLQIRIPALRERPDDIPPLVEHFIAKFSQRFNRPISNPSHEVMQRLTAYRWPGNVRELQNAIERAVVLSPDGSIHLEHLFCVPLDHSRDTDADSMVGDRFLTSLPLGHAEAKAMFERTYLEQLLKEAGGNISKAARLAGKHRVEIYRLIDKYKIDPKELN